MSEPTSGLSDSERAELEQLRQEKAAREKAEADARERAELERLRREKEPGDDLKMPVAQKIIIIACVVILAVFVWYMIVAG